jgi:DNA-directed RNA polymerase subunit beta'
MKLHPFVYKGFNADNDGDAMSVHVPVTDESVREAATLFPSKNVFSTTGHLLTAPSMESQWGLWLLTKDGKKTSRKFKTSKEAAKAFEAGDIGLTDIIKIGGKNTTLGRAMVNGALPRALRDPDVILTKEKVGDIISTMARENPKVLPATLDHFKDLGYRMAYESGATIGMEDIKPWEKIREQALRPARAAVRRGVGVVKAYEPAIGKLTAAIRNGPESNELISMLRSGALGKDLAVRQMVTAPVLFKDSSGKAVPSAVEKSFSEGLSTDEYWSSLYGARLGVIGRSYSTREPGALANALIQTTIDNIISKYDCGTQRGIEVPLEDALGRFPAGGTYGKWRDQPIDERLIARFRRKGLKRLLVRSPLRCEVGQGTCAKCWGLDEKGQVPRIGTNVGVLSGHAMTEPSTQLAMNAFHTGGVHLPGKGRDESFKEMKALLEVTENLPNKAVIARQSGTVTKIEKNRLGGHNVWVGDQKHYVSPQRTLRPGLLGKKLRIGQSLTPGLKDPRELHQAIGFPNTQEYMAKKLQSIFMEGGNRIPLKHFETVIRSSAGDVEITNDPSGTFMVGQTTSFGIIDAMSAKRARKVRGSTAAGMRLMERVPGQEDLFGKVLDRAGARRLGAKKVMATPNPIHFEPTWKGVKYIPQNRDDWLARMAYQGLQKTLQEGASQGMISNLHGHNPLPGIMFGAELKVKPGPRGEY